MELRNAALHHGLQHDREQAVGLHRDLQRDPVQVAPAFIAVVVKIARVTVLQHLRVAVHATTSSERLGKIAISRAGLPVIGQSCPSGIGSNAKG